MASFSVEEQSAYIKIEFYKGTVTAEIFKTLQKVCGEQSLSQAAVYIWVDNFKDGRDNVKSRHSPGRTTEASTEENVVKVKQILDTDRRLTCEEIARDVGISHGSVHNILSSKLSMRRWVPHCLTEEQKTARTTVAENLLERHKTEGENFLNRIVAIDETWIRSYEPELKRQSSEWHKTKTPQDPLNTGELKLS